MLYNNLNPPAHKLTLIQCTVFKYNNEQQTKPTPIPPPPHPSPHPTPLDSSPSQASKLSPILARDLGTL